NTKVRNRRHPCGCYEKRPPRSTYCRREYNYQGYDDTKLTTSLDCRDKQNTKAGRGEANANHQRDHCWQRSDVQVEGEVSDDKEECELCKGKNKLRQKFASEQSIFVYRSNQ